MNAPVRQPLPNREQIGAIDDIEALHALLADAQASAQKIEVDLEFRSEGDSDWEARARSALTAHRICIGEVNKRIRRLSAPHARETGDDAAARKVAAKATQASLETVALERRRIKAEQAELTLHAAIEAQREKTKRQALTMIEGLDFSRQFMAVAKELMQPFDYEYYVAKTESAQRSAIIAAADRVTEGEG